MRTTGLFDEHRSCARDAVPVVDFRPTHKPAESSADLPGGQPVMVFSRRSNTVGVQYNAISSFHRAVMLSKTRRTLRATSKYDSLNLFQSVSMSSVVKASSPSSPRCVKCTSRLGTLREKRWHTAKWRGTSPWTKTPPQAQLRSHFTNHQFVQAHRRYGRSCS